MSDFDTSSIPFMSVIAAAIAAIAKLAHWSGNLWATVSRERLVAERETAALDRANETRIADQHNAAINHLAQRVDDHTVRDLAGLAEVKEAVGGLASKVDTIAWWQERTPPPGSDDGTDPVSRPSIASERRRKLRPP